MMPGSLSPFAPRPCKFYPVRGPLQWRPALAAQREAAMRINDLQVRGRALAYSRADFSVGCRVSQFLPRVRR